MSIQREVLSFVFPELDTLAPSRRDLALQFANKTPFDFVEWFGVLSGIAIAVVVLRHPPQLIQINSEFLASILSTLFAAFVAVLLIVPFLIRKTRRGVRKFIEREGS